MTNLFEGLQAAVSLLGGPMWLRGQQQFSAAQVGPHTNGGDASVRRIFLFSDGLVNRGICEDPEIQAAVAAWANLGITTSTFGIGTDFNEPLMRGIAEAGKGRYTYLEDGREIPKLVSKSVHDLLALYGSEATLEVRGLAYTTVSQLYAGAEDDEEGSAALPGITQLGDLHYGNKRTVLLELEVAPPGNAPQEDFEAAEWMLTFLHEGTPAHFSGRLSLGMTRDRAALGEENIAVSSAFVVRRAAEMDAEIADLLMQRNVERARAMKNVQLGILRENLQAARDAGSEDNVTMLQRVLERAEQLATRLEDDREDVENVRRRCVQEQELNCAMSACGWEARSNSSIGSPMPSPPGSPLGSPRGGRSNMLAFSPPLSPPLSPGLTPVGSPWAAARFPRQLSDDSLADTLSVEGDDGLMSPMALGSPRPVLAQSTSPGIPASSPPSAPAAGYDGSTCPVPAASTPPRPAHGLFQRATKLLTSSPLFSSSANRGGKGVGKNYAGS